MTSCDNLTNLSSSQVTRVKLLGVGIVCGMEIFRDTQCFISITKGVGVTSAGQVICISDKTLKYYKEYPDPYRYFHNLINCKKDKAARECKVWELLPHREEGATSIVPQDIASVDKPFLDDKVVLLYLEDEAKMIVRILLIDQLDMWEILKCTCIFNTHCLQTEPKEEEDISIFDKETDTALPGEEELYNAVHKKYMLNAVVIRRFGYGQVEIDDLYPEDATERKLIPNFDFTDAFAEVSREKFFKEYEAIIDETLENLDDEMDKLHGYFGCMIDACHCKEKKADAEERSPCNPVTSDSPTETGLQMHNIKVFNNYFTYINKKWAVFKKNRQPVGSIQYFYDFIKDLVKTYNQLLTELYELTNECCTDTDCFPRHLMLGRIHEEVSFQPSLFRQPYLQPPVFNNNANRLQEIRFLHWRMVIMMKCFYIPDWELDDLSDESYYDVLQLENERSLGEDPKLPVRITPGRMFNEPLGKQTIPFYYNLSNSPYSLQYYWDYKFTKHNREDHQLSYFSKEVPGYSNLDFVVHPFLYSLDEYPFYRIEGHTGMLVEEAITGIKNLRRRYALSFAILSLTFENFKSRFLPVLDDVAAVGPEHVGGVQKGYSFVLLHDGKPGIPGRVIADFQIPFLFTEGEVNNMRISPPVGPGPVTPAVTSPVSEPVKSPVTDGDKEEVEKEKKGMEVKRRALQKRIGEATKNDAMTEIAGIDKKMEAVFHSVGIRSFLQLGKLSANDIPVLATILDLSAEKIDPEWFRIASSHVRTFVMEKMGASVRNDDLKKIKGIFEKTEIMLNKAGITSYAQLAKLSEEDAPALAHVVGLLEHVVKTEWLSQAKALAK